MSGTGGATCPVCQGTDTSQFLEAQGRLYHRCAVCLATFLDQAHFPTPDVERSHYETHENDPHDPRYRSFLSRLAGPLLQKLNPGAKGLDYGSGPGPALAAMMREAGHNFSVYDPFYAPDRSVLDTTYDVITCTETAEHFHQPHQEFAQFDSLLRRGGWLGVMTMFQTDDARFLDWHYRKDPTHVVFYREATMRWLGCFHAWSCEFPGRNVVLFQKL